MRRPLGVPNSNSFGAYLGCPMEVDGRNTTPLNDIISRIRQKISTWKFMHISPAGKLILINTILASLAAHIISIYLLPVKVKKKVTSFLPRYWRSTSQERKPIYWRKRTLLEKHKEEGGLSMRNIRNMNISLLAKQAWRIDQNKSSIIHKIYQAKYHNDPLAALSQQGRNLIIAPTHTEVCGMRRPK